MFEHLKERDQRQPPARQGLLVPETVELSYREAAALEELLPDFGHLGLEIERFGQNTYVIKAVPEILAETEAGPLVTELAGKLAATGPSPDIGRKIEEGLHVLACHGAIRAGQRLTSEEMRALLSRLDDCINPWHCPHGRPTAINWRTKEIERSFKRVL